jgi:hypothetical protein
MPARILDYARRAVVPAQGVPLFGMEVELEGMAAEVASEASWPRELTKHWRFVADGSLREGLELVSLPLKAETLEAAVEVLYNVVIGGENGLHPSVRTGIHIHAGCLDMDTDQVLRVCQHYALVEPLLFNFVAEWRDENIYCIPWYRSHNEPKALYRWLSQLTTWDERPPVCKYSALNTGPLSSFGTIEYRHAPTFEELALTKQWIQIVARLQSTYTSTYDVLDEWERLGPAAFAAMVFDGMNVPVLSSRDYEDLDVDRVAEYLRPRRDVAHVGWGVPPQLETRGTVIAGPTVRSGRIGRMGGINFNDLILRTHYEGTPAPEEEFPEDYEPDEFPEEPYDEERDEDEEEF